jgi:uncharacterized membrane protein
MLLCFIEGVGLLIGFMIGFYRKRINIQSLSRRTKIILLVLLVFLVVAISGGTVAYIWIAKPVDLNEIKQLVVGLPMFIPAGWAVGIFANWVTEKLSG